MTDLQLPANVTCNTTLWAACIGGAAQRDDYRAQIEATGLQVVPRAVESAEVRT